MDPKLPWLSEKFLSKVLNICTGLEITRSESEPAVPLGDNYFSTILRVTVNYKRKQDGDEESVVFITKSLPEGVMSEVLQSIKIMEKELDMYRSVLPFVQDLVRTQITPKSFISSDETLLILEDLRVKGYKMFDRVQQLDFEHCKESLQLLAKFHAGSVVLHDRDASLFDIVSEEMIYPRSECQRAFVENGFKLLTAEVERWPDAELASRLRKVASSIFDEIGEAVLPGEFSVLNHGDFWGNNLLFYYDDHNNLCDVKLIDWQMCRWTSPAMDLQMFFNTSVRDVTSIPRLSAIYLSALNETLSQLGSERRLSEECLLEDLKRTECYGLMISVAVLPICVGTRGEPMDFSETTIEDFSSGFTKSNPYAHVYRGSRYKEIIPNLLNNFIKKKVL
uniref:CHK kinase-like domain-containing protein n=1 Tax=Clastoptera arizonana TaxID=38151 RepID=A0A1B6CM61_9HEMI